MKLTTRKQRIKFDVRSDLKAKHRKERIEFDVRSEVKALQIICGALKGLVVRKLILDK